MHFDDIKALVMGTVFKNELLEVKESSLVVHSLSELYL